jgi:hypothetical protein
MWHLILGVQFLLRRILYSYVFLLETRSRQLIRCFIQWGHVILLPPFVLRDLAFPLESDLIVCKTSSPSICVLSSPSFMDVEFPSDEAILEAMIMDFRPLLELETLQVCYQRNPWPEPSNGLYLENYDA